VRDTRGHAIGSVSVGTEAVHEFGGELPLVSVVLRTGNRPSLLSRSLATVAEQTYSPIEVVVAGGALGALDEDAVRATLGGMAVTFAAAPTGSKAARTANDGVAAAAGTLVGFLDEGDELLPAHVATLALALAGSGAAIAVSDCETVQRELGADGAIVRDEGRGRRPGSARLALAELCSDRPSPLLGVMFRRDAIAAAGGFDEELEPFADWDLLMRTAQSGSLLHVPEITARLVQWESTERVASTDGALARDGYLRAMAKYPARFTPEALADLLTAVREELGSRGRTIAEFEQRNRDLERAGRAREDAAGEIAHLRARLGEATRTIQAITQSRAWKLIESYRSGAKERLVPAGTRRRQLYDRVLGTGDARLADRRPEGVDPQHLLARQVVRERFLPPADAAAAEVLSTTVSVVVPTLNAGQEFRSVLERIGAQEELPGIEVVAVDSGSTDGTLELCARYGVKVVPYPPGPFNHGMARNLGAGAAAGEFLVFISQDALPVGNRAVAGLVRALQSDPRIAAASARQIPRSDADLFTCWALWGYREKVLRYPSDTVVGVDPGQLSTLPPIERRRVAQIDNVLSCVRRTAFEGLGFRTLPIAEDLDLGLRLIEQGYRIAFMSSVAVVHSHSRPPAYHLRRSFTEWRSLGDLLGVETQVWPERRFSSMQQAASGAMGLYRRVGEAIAATRLEPGTRPGDAVAQVRAELAGAGRRGTASQEESLDAALGQVHGALGLAGGTGGPDHLGPFLSVYLDLLSSFSEYLSCLTVLDGRERDFRLSLFKFCAEAIGHCLADFSIWGERRRLALPGLAEVAAILGQAV